MQILKQDADARKKRRITPFLTKDLFYFFEIAVKL